MALLLEMSIVSALIRQPRFTMYIVSHQPHRSPSDRCLDAGNPAPDATIASKAPQHAVRTGCPIRNPYSPLLHSLAVLFAFFFQCLQPLAQYSVEGGMTATPLDFQGRPKTSLEFRFRVAVEPGRWSIQHDDLAALGGKRASAWREELAWDGRDLYRIDHMDHTNAPRRGKGPTSLYAFARPGALLSGATPIERILWLAFCSGDLLHTNGSLPSFRDPRAVPEDLVKYTFEAIPGSKLPLRFQEHDPGFILLDGGTRVLGLPAPFTNGYVPFEFEALASTNVANQPLPAAFLARFFLVNDGPPGAPAVRWNSCTYSGWVAQAASATQSFTRPVIASSATVYDFRFTNRAGRPLKYSEQAGGNWLDRDDPNLSNTIRTKSAPIQRVPAHALQGHRWLPALFVLTVFAVPALLIVVRHGRLWLGNKTNNKHER